jgi:hypothetical protein
VEGPCVGAPFLPRAALEQEPLWMWAMGIASAYFLENEVGDAKCQMFPVDGTCYAPCFCLSSPPPRLASEWYNGNFTDLQDIVCREWVVP